MHVARSGTNGGQGAVDVVVPAVVDPEVVVPDVVVAVVVDVVVTSSQRPHVSGHNRFNAMPLIVVAHSPGEIVKHKGSKSRQELGSWHTVSLLPPHCRTTTLGARQGVHSVHVTSSVCGSQDSKNWPFGHVAEAQADGGTIDVVGGGGGAIVVVVRVTTSVVVLVVEVKVVMVVVVVVVASLEHMRSLSRSHSETTESPGGQDLHGRQSALPPAHPASHLPLPQLKPEQSNAVVVVVAAAVVPPATRTRLNEGVPVSSKGESRSSWRKSMHLTAGSGSTVVSRARRYTARHSVPASRHDCKQADRLACLAFEIRSGEPITEPAYPR